MGELGVNAKAVRSASARSTSPTTVFDALAELMGGEASPLTTRKPVKDESVSGSIGSLKRAMTWAEVWTPVVGKLATCGRKLTQQPGTRASEGWNGAWKRPAPMRSDEACSNTVRTRRPNTSLPTRLAACVTWAKAEPTVTTSPTAGAVRQVVVKVSARVKSKPGSPPAVSTALVTVTDQPPITRGRSVSRRKPLLSSSGLPDFIARTTSRVKDTRSTGPLSSVSRGTPLRLVSTRGCPEPTSEFVGMRTETLAEAELPWRAGSPTALAGKA